mgnify:CR=1 FL=1
MTAHGGKAVAVNDERMTIEEAMPEGRTVIVEFPSKTDAETLYNDAAYQAFKKIPHKYTQCDSIIIEKGFMA